MDLEDFKPKEDKKLNENLDKPEEKIIDKQKCAICQGEHPTSECPTSLNKPISNEGKF